MKFTWLACGLIAFAIVNYGGWELYQSSSGLNFQSQSSAASSTLTMGGAMLFGVIASALVAALKQLPQQQPVALRRLMYILLRPNTFSALLVSPVVFYGVLTGLGDGGVGPMLYLSAFQNGFFWQTALVPPAIDRAAK